MLLDKKMLIFPTLPLDLEWNGRQKQLFLPSQG